MLLVVDGLGDLWVDMMEDGKSSEESTSWAVASVNRYLVIPDCGAVCLMKLIGPFFHSFMQEAPPRRIHHFYWMLHVSRRSWQLPGCDSLAPDAYKA